MGWRTGDGDSAEPQLRYRRAVLLEWSNARTRVSWIEGYLPVARDGLDSATLQRTATELEMPTEAAETIAA
jgi:hypothetical protein